MREGMAAQAGMHMGSNILTMQNMSGRHGANMGTELPPMYQGCALWWYVKNLWQWQWL